MTTLHLRKINRLPFLLIPFALAWVAVSVQALSPTPDGGYPGYNTAEGTNVLLHLTTGIANTANGFAALQNNTTGDANTANGTNALLHNTTGGGNTATGTNALLSNTSSYNTANGNAALQNNTTGNYNTANGNDALSNNTTGFQNTATGDHALYFNTTISGVSGNYNTANGQSALYNNTTGSQNTANGIAALWSNMTGNDNTANGGGALYLNTSGFANTADGWQALHDNTNAFGSTAVGWQALEHSTGGFCTALGSSAGLNVTTGFNVICIGAAGANVNDSCFIGNIRGATTQNADAIPVLIDSAGQLGTASSSRRFKHEIKPMDKASEAILALKPVTFHYKSDKTGTAQFGLIAEEVADVNPDLVVRDEKGEIYTVRYDAVNAMLLNEFLKEHRKVEEQEATITQLKKDFRATVAQLTTRLDEQATQIQKVSTQVEMSKPAAKVVNNNE